MPITASELHAGALAQKLKRPLPSGRLRQACVCLQRTGGRMDGMAAGVTLAAAVASRRRQCNKHRYKCLPRSGNAHCKDGYFSVHAPPGSVGREHAINNVHEPIVRGAQFFWLAAILTAQGVSRMRVKE